MCKTLAALHAFDTCFAPPWRTAAHRCPARKGVEDLGPTPRRRAAHGKAPLRRATEPTENRHCTMRWNPDLLGVVAPFVKLEDIGRFAVASRDIDEALRQPDERAAVLAHLGTAEVRAAASLEHAALAEATRAWRPVGANRRRVAHLVVDNDAREVNARCAEVASLLRRHPRATCRVEAHAGADLQPPVLAFALATARARLVRDRLVAAFARLGVNARRVELASMRPRAPATRVEVYLRLRDGATEVEVPARPTDGAPPHALQRHVPRVWRRRRAWPLSRLLNVATKWLGKPSGVLRV